MHIKLSKYYYIHTGTFYWYLGGKHDVFVLVHFIPFGDIIFVVDFTFHFSYLNYLVKPLKSML